MTTTNNKKNKYEITVAGKGGDFWFFPMSPEQVAFWQKEGNEALAEHLNGGCEVDAIPTALKLGRYEDIGEQAGGINLTENGELTVRDESGKLCFEATLDDLSDDGLIVITRNVPALPIGGFFRTYEKAWQIYELTLSDKFDPVKLRLNATDTSEGDLIIGASYAGQEILDVSYEDKEWAMHDAEVFG